jgi:hypothetical protein
MPHPFTQLPLRRYSLIFIPLFILTLIVWAVLLAVDPKSFSNGEFNIVDFEFAGSISQVDRIFADWRDPGKIKAGFSLGLDFLFIALYSTTIALACVWATLKGQERGWPVTFIGIPLAWGQWVAAILDVVENIALIVLLFGSKLAALPVLAKIAAIPKFVLIALGILYGAIAWLAIVLGM